MGGKDASWFVWRVGRRNRGRGGRGRGGRGRGRGLGRGRGRGRGGIATGREDDVVGRDERGRGGSVVGARGARADRGGRGRGGKGGEISRGVREGRVGKFWERDFGGRVIFNLQVEKGGVGINHL